MQLHRDPDTAAPYVKMLLSPIADFLGYIIFQFRKSDVNPGEIRVSAHVAERDIL